MGIPASLVRDKGTTERVEREADAPSKGMKRDTSAPPSKSSERVIVVRGSWPPNSEARVHDTIPAPPWYDDGEDGLEEITKTDLQGEADR